ncbi:MAG: hypothetical protein E7399_09970 [Ruminococcaceae bacterium]|nr:hypothetical protein [Oscillospiraceae bacterium]
MKRKWIETCQTLLITQMNHWIIITAVMTVLGLFKEERTHLLLWFVFGIVPIMLFFVRESIRNFFLFFAIHMVLPVAAVYLTGLLLSEDIVLRIILIALTVIYVIWSIVIRLKSKKNSENLIPPLVAICAMGILTLIENLQCKRGWEWYYLLMAILYLSGYFINFFMNNYLRFLSVNESSAAVMPEQEIFSSGMKQTVLFTIAGVLVLFLTANVKWVSYVLSWVGNVLLVVLRAFFSLFSKEESEEVPVFVMQEQVAPDMSGLAEGGKSGLLWLILEKIIMTLVAVGIVALIVFAVVMFFRFLWNHFHEARKGEEQKIQKGRDLHEVCGIEKNAKETSTVWLPFLNNRDKVRKIYRKQILKNKNSIVGNHNMEDLERMTAKECCDKMPIEKDFADILKKIYEKARYSPNDITSEDVKSMKTAGK